MEILYTQCYLLFTLEKYIFSLGITSFRIESVNLCQNESVTIYEGHSQYDKRIATLTNQSSPVTPAIYVRVEKGYLYVGIRVMKCVILFVLINCTKPE